MSSMFEIGEKLVVVARGGLVLPFGEQLQVHAVPGLKLVELTIQEEVEVPGSYNPAGVHMGYTALGSDGWLYGCQHEKFDEASQSPYQNWQRIYVDGIHYRKDSQGRISEWLIDKGHDFTDRYLNWEVTMMMGRMQPDTQRAVAARINSEFPACRVEQCVRYEEGSADDHRPAGWFYSKHGCGVCRMLDAGYGAHQSQAC